MTRRSVPKITTSNQPQTRVHPLAIACRMLLSTLSLATISTIATAPVFAESFQSDAPSGLVSGNATLPTSVPAVGSVDYRANRLVARVVVEVEKDGLPADGVSPNRITVRVFDEKGQVLKAPVLATIEHSGGRILLDSARTDEMGPGAKDADRATQGIQLPINDGVASFRLMAPSTANDVKLRITAGSAVVEGSISYLPELRDMLAVGLIEGIIHARKQANSTLVPIRIEDGFERELRYWTREFNNGKGTAGARIAFFLKGKVKGDWLLTMAVDSDKDLKDRLYRDIDPNKFYPVYGDSSIVGFDAKSQDKIYIRLESGKTYALYGDFSTGDGFSQLSEGGAVASSLKSRSLGAYNRSMVGLRLHKEQKNYFINGFVANDNLKQIVEEYLAKGTSGPFAVSNLQAIEGSERIEIITRDRNGTDRVLNIIPQVRLVDYSFEPFSGRILFKAPIPSLDINGNPQSIRITYEVEQGGPKFLTYGIDGQAKLGGAVEIGGAYIRDENPLSPYQLGSVNLGVKINDRSRIVLEVAQSESTGYSGTAFGSTLTPAGTPGEVQINNEGMAYRLEANYANDKWDARLWYLDADPGFYNPAAPVAPGRVEAGAALKFQINKNLGLYGAAQQTTDRLQLNDPQRQSAALGLNWRINDRLTLDASVRESREDANFTASSAIAGNSIIGGGFMGNAADPINPTTGTSVLTAGAGNVISSGQPNPTFANGTSLRLGAEFRATDRWSVQGEVEGGSDSQTRFGLGSSYQINERSRVYGRFEKTTGLTSASSLNPSDRSNAFVFGIDNTFGQGPTVFSEFRMRDAISAQLASARDQQLATGVRNTWQVKSGLAYTASAEHLKIFSGTNRDALALAGGVDWTASELWKTSARLEYRRLSDDNATVSNDRQDQWLSTVSIARKLNRDWTLLARNYALWQNNNDNGKRLEERFQIGAAWRPVDHNRWNSLMRYELKTVRDTAGAATPVGAIFEKYRSNIFSVHGDYHPSRPWWFNGRFAAKSTTDKTLPAGQEKYSAFLVGGRAVYDITENWDIGLMGAYMWSPAGKAKQKAIGAEVGYLVRQNLWLSVGYNATGFSDRDLTGTDYTNKGAYIRLRFKFDESLFSGGNRTINRSLNRN